MIETVFMLPWNSKEAPKLEAMFNLRNERCQKVFKKETTKNNKLLRVFGDVKDLDTTTEKFLKKNKQTTTQALPESNSEEQKRIRDGRKTVSEMEVSQE